MDALILVDVQNDFLPGGALAVPGGDEVVPIANRLMKKFPLVVATQDWHPADHQSFASQHAGRNVGDLIDLDGLTQVLWPDHCVQNTFGAEFSAELNRDDIAHVIRKGTRQRIDSYSGFFDNGHRQSTGLQDYLRENGVTNVSVMGLATDYCVRFTAIDAAQLGFDTTVCLAGCRAVELSPGDGDAAIAEMASAGVNIDRSSDCGIGP